MPQDMPLKAGRRFQQCLWNTLWQAVEHFLPWVEDRNGLMLDVCDPTGQLYRFKLKFAPWMPSAWSRCAWPCCWHLRSAPMRRFVPVHAPVPRVWHPAALHLSEASPTPQYWLHSLCMGRTCALFIVHQ